MWSKHGLHQFLLREQLIMFQFQSRKYMIIIGTQCCVFITKPSLNFTMAKLLKLAVNYSWYHMAHAVAEPVYYRQNLTLQQFKVIQGHWSWCQSKAHMQLPRVVNETYDAETETSESPVSHGGAEGADGGGVWGFSVCHSHPVVLALRILPALTRQWWCTSFDLGHSTKVVTFWQRSFLIVVNASLPCPKWMLCFAWWGDVMVQTSTQSSWWIERCIELCWESSSLQLCLQVDSSSWWRQYDADGHGVLQHWTRDHTTPVPVDWALFLFSVRPLSSRRLMTASRFRSCSPCDRP